MKPTIPTAALIALVFMACGNLPIPTAIPVSTLVPTVPPTVTAIPPTSTPEPTGTFTPEPTATIVPTATTAPTATPPNQIFRDDFDGALQPGWTWENESADRWNITEDGWLQILGEDDALLYGEAQSNLLWTEVPAGDFVITAHLRAAPVADFQQATIYVYHDLENFIAINRGYCGPCLAGGNGVYMEYKINGRGSFYSTTFRETDLYLRLQVQGDVISGHYATVPDQWHRLAWFGGNFTFQQAGLGVTNADMERDANSDLLGLFDYFEVTRP